MSALPWFLSVWNMSSGYLRASCSLLWQQIYLSKYATVYIKFFNFHSLTLIFGRFFCVPAAILDDPMECSRGERLAITLAKDSINRSSNRSTTGKLEVDIFELLRDSEYETGETSKC